MRKFIITYSWPICYKGSYVVSAEDGLDASSKVEKYLKSVYGAVKDSSSIVTEIYYNNLFNVDTKEWM